MPVPIGLNVGLRGIGEPDVGTRYKPPAVASSTIAFVQSRKLYPGAPIANGTTFSFNTNPTAGNFLFAVMSWTGGPSGAIAPTDNPTLSGYTGLTAYYSGSQINAHPSCAIKPFYIENCAGGAFSTTVGGISADSDFSLTMYEFSGVALSSAIDNTSTRTSPAGIVTPTANSVSVSVANGMVILCYANEVAGQGAFTQGTNMTLAENNTGHADAQEYRLNVPAAAYTPTITTAVATNDWLIYGITVKGA